MHCMIEIIALMAFYYYLYLKHAKCVEVHLWCFANWSSSTLAQVYTLRTVRFPQKLARPSTQTHGLPCERTSDKS